ncbi:MAG: DUF971 domain-containing protein [Planctomycetaceae bacterium]
MAPSPLNVRVLTQEQCLQVVWPDSRTDHIGFWTLRTECPCAACVNEFTGARILIPESVPRDVRPVGVEFAGNYGLKVVWSDRHNSGIFTWERIAAHRPAVGGRRNGGLPILRAEQE